MRQVTDMLVWLAVIFVVAAVVYVTPRLADYVASRDSGAAQASRMSDAMAYHERPDSPNAP